MNTLPTYNPNTGKYNFNLPPTPVSQRKSRKNRKNRKATRKNRKATRKNRK